MESGMGIHERATAYIKRDDPFKELRIALADQIGRGEAFSWNDKALLAKAIEDMIDAKISSALKQQEKV